MNYNPVGRFEIYTTDIERAKNFYANVFQKGDRVDLSQEGIQMFGFPMIEEAGGAPGALVHMADYGPSGQGTIVYFSCEDCAVEESRVEANGGKVHQSKMSIGQHGFISMITDTESNMIGLHSNK